MLAKAGLQQVNRFPHKVIKRQLFHSIFKAACLYFGNVQQLSHKAGHLIELAFHLLKYCRDPAILLLSREHLREHFRRHHEYGQRSSQFMARQSDKGILTLF